MDIELPLITDSLIMLRDKAIEKKGELSKSELEHISMSFQLQEQISILHEFQYPILSYIKGMEKRSRKNSWTIEEERLTLYFVSYFYRETKTSCHDYISRLLNRSVASVRNRYYTARREIKKRNQKSVELLRKENLDLTLKNMELSTINELRQQAFESLERKNHQLEQELQRIRYEFLQAAEKGSQRKPVLKNLNSPRFEKRVLIHSDGIVQYPC